MSKPTVSKKDIVIFTPGEKDHPKIINSYPVDHDGEHPAIVTMDTYGDEGESDMTVFLDGRGTTPVKNVPHSTYANKGQSSWKKGS